MRRMTESTYHCQNLKDFDPSLNKMNRYNNIIPCTTHNFPFFSLNLPPPVTHTEVSVPLFKSESEDWDSYINANYVNVRFFNFFYWT